MSNLPHGEMFASYYEKSMLRCIHLYFINKKIIS